MQSSVWCHKRLYACVKMERKLREILYMRRRAQKEQQLYGDPTFSDVSSDRKNVFGWSSVFLWETMYRKLFGTTRVCISFFTVARNTHVNRQLCLILLVGPSVYWESCLVRVVVSSLLPQQSQS